MDGIQIPRGVADAEGVPDDLDSSALGPYRFPNPRRRSTAAWFYAAAAALAAVAALTGLGAGMWAVAAMFIFIAWLHRRAAWNLGIEQEAALATAATAVKFTVGHASAAVAFVGNRSRPVWNVILYSASEPPDQRALVRLDAVSGETIDEPFIESIEPISEPERPTSTH